jgi:hypothetical protein
LRATPITMPTCLVRAARRAIFGGGAAARSGRSHSPVLMLQRQSRWRRNWSRLRRRVLCPGRGRVPGNLAADRYDSLDPAQRRGRSERQRRHVLRLRRRITGRSTAAAGSITR